MEAVWVFCVRIMRKIHLLDEVQTLWVCEVVAELKARVNWKFEENWEVSWNLDVEEMIDLGEDKETVKLGFKGEGFEKV